MEETVSFSLIPIDRRRNLEHVALEQAAIIYRNSLWQESLVGLGGVPTGGESDTDG